MSEMKYEKLKINYKIPEELDQLFDEYVTWLNTGNGVADDYYRTEIQMTLNWCYREALLPEDKIQELRDYYQRKGIRRRAEGKDKRNE